MPRTNLMKVRLTPAESADIQTKATAAELTVSDFVRHRLLDYRLRQTGLERDSIRHLTRLGSNLNQIARWANTHKSRIDSLEIILRLDAILVEAKKITEGQCM